MPGGNPTKLALIAIGILIIGVVGGSFIKELNSLSAIGLFFLIFSFFYYCVNIYEVGGKYKYASILMISLPMVPSIILFSSFNQTATFIFGELIGLFLFTGLIIYIAYHVKQLIRKYILKYPEIHKNPPDWTYATFFSIVFFLLMSAIIAAFVFGMAGSTNTAPIYSLAPIPTLTPTP